jgi:ribose transport system ATP-binding protein
VRENLTITLLRTLARAGVVDRRRQSEVVERFIARLGIKVADAEQPVRELSGGNQQKVLIARWMAMQPRLLMLDEPTRGVDVGAKADIARLIAELADAGMGILLTTSELEELVALSDAAVVVREGRTVARVDGEALNEQALMAAMAEGDAGAAAGAAAERE